MFRLVDVNKFFVQSCFFLRPVLFQFVLLFEFVKNFFHQFGTKHCVWSSKCCIMPCNDHFHNFTTRESISFWSNVLNNFLSDIFHSYKFFASVDWPRMFVQKVCFFLEWSRGCAILHEIMEQHRLAFILCWSSKAYNFVNSIMNCFIKLIWGVSC